MIDPASSSSPETVDRLAAGELAAWRPLLEALVTAPEPGAAPPEVVRAWLARDPPGVWVERAKQAAARADSPHFTTIGRAMRPFRAWWDAGVAAVLPADHPDALRLRYDALLGRADDEALAETRALLAAVGDLPWAADAWLLLARRASEHGRHDEALAAAEQADLAGAGDRAARARGAALLRLRRIGEAMDTLEAPLRRPGPQFGGGGAFRSVPTDGPLDEVLDELATIASWCEARTPEWVRALGGWWEVTGDTDAERRFQQGLAALAATGDVDRALEDLEVVARQAGERGHRRAAAAAARVAARLRPDDAGSTFVADAADAIAAGELDGLWAVFEAHQDSDLLTETEAGHALAEALLDALLPDADPRAERVARALYDTKCRTFGPDVPAAWLELQNVGTVLAQLGRAEEARAALTAAADGLARHVGEQHPRVQMVRRNLARLG